MIFHRTAVLTLSACIALAPLPLLGAAAAPIVNDAAVQASGKAELPAVRRTADVPIATAGKVALADGKLILNDVLSIAVQDNNPPPPYASLLTTGDEADDTPIILTTDTRLTRNDLWKRIRDGFAMAELDSPLIERHENWYASRPDYVERMTERSQRYLYYIVQEVEKRGMPMEIALLPMIESAFNPGALSTASASGIWQFIPSTGKNYGLKQNWWYDGRRNVVSATNSALDYLQKLHNQFGDWELALAAYNWGEGAVERAQKKNRRLGKPTDYSSLKMPNETRNYVPKLLAVKNIVSDPESFGLTLQPVPDKPYFTAVSTARHIDVKLAAQMADISLEEFIALNPAHNRPVILQENSSVLLPVEKAEIFRANLEGYGESLVSWQAYKSKKGERLDKVAPRFGMSVATLKSINGLSPRAKTSNGQELLVPLNGEEADNDFEVFNTHLMPSYRSPGRTITHTVRKGDTLSSIARRYRVSTAKLRNWNDNLGALKPGQKITIVQLNKSRKSARPAKKTRTASATQKRVKQASTSRERKAARPPQQPVKIALNP